MTLAVLYVAIGLAVLVAAGDMLVKGAVNLALRIGVPALVVSLTIVAFGTSAPELVISVDAVLDGLPGIALGNVVGSNTANILLVLGVPAVISGITMQNCDTERSYFIMLAGSVLFIALAFTGGFGAWQALVLLGALTLVLAEQGVGAYRDLKADRARAAEEEVEGADPKIGGARIALFLVLGLVGLPLGANLLIDGAQDIARTFGLSDAVIGLTLVAIGTSLPELATTVAAAIRREADVALGNVIGSNMFNLLAIIGVAGLFGRIPVDRSFLTLDLWVMLGASLLLLPFIVLRWRLTKRWGVLFCGLYVTYLAVAVAG